MRVIMDNGGAKTHTVNDKAQISHEIEKKTSLDKKRGNVLEKRNERTVGDTAKANTTRGSPSAAQQKAEHFSKQSPRGAETKAAVHHEASSKSELAKPSGGVFQERSKTVGKLDKPALDKKRMLSPEAMERRRKKFKNKRLRFAPRKKYKVLENGVVNTGEITKKKARTIYSQVPRKMQNAKPKKISREQAELINIAMGGGMPAGKKTHIPKVVAGAGKAVDIAKKPLSVVKGEFYKQADKSDDNGVKSVKLGMRITFSDTFFFVLSRNYIYENFSYITRTCASCNATSLAAFFVLGLLLHYAHARVATFETVCMRWTMLLHYAHTRELQPRLTCNVRTDYYVRS